jgi:hypothetical protein
MMDNDANHRLSFDIAQRDYVYNPIKSFVIDPRMFSAPITSREVIMDS